MDATDRRRRASAEAAEWFVRLQADDLPRALRDQYVDWLRDSPTHVAEMLRVAQVHGSLEQFQRWASVAAGAPEGDSNVVPIGMRREAQEGEDQSARGRTRTWGFALAATVAAALLGAAFLVPRSLGQVIDTERGESREIALSDGSVVHVDPQTLLRVKFTDQARRVYLERGRALFNVAKNPSRPFLVQADDTTIRAVGTAFGVEREEQGVIITVSEGKVAVLALEDESVLTAGQQLVVEQSGSTEPVRKVDSTRELAWADGRLIFENDRVRRVIEEFNRYNRVQLLITDEALAERPISGVFSASDPESFIAFIQTVAPVRVVRRGDEGITLSPIHPR